MTGRAATTSRQSPSQCGANRGYRLRAPEALPATRMFEYRDVGGARGFLVYAGGDSPLAAGGLRVQPNLQPQLIEALAQDMVLKQRLLRTNVDGAKCGLSYDPSAADKQDVMRRFLRFLRPHLQDRLSLGPDSGTTWEEIECLAQQEGIASVKSSIARAQGLAEEDVLRRLALLNAPVGALTLGQRRAGHVLARAAQTIVDVQRRNGAQPTWALQGVGTLGRAAALSLDLADFKLLAIADERASLSCANGIDVERLLACPARLAVSAYGSYDQCSSRDAILGADVDVLVLAACENSMNLAQARALRARAVVVGANHGLAPAVEHLLDARGIPVIPDFVGGIGGSASMDALFAPTRPPTPREVLDLSSVLVAGLVRRIVAISRVCRVTPRAAALALASMDPVSAGDRPYGLRALVTHAPPAVVTTPCTVPVNRGPRC